SLGAVLYECLTRRAPFSGESSIETAAQLIHVDPPPPSQLNLSVPPELDRITLKALAKKPEARYQSALEFRSDLVKIRDLLGREDSLVPSHIARKFAGLPVSSFTNLHLRLRRPRVLFPAGLMVIFLSLLGMMGMPRFWPSAPHSPNPEAKRW